MDSGSACGTNLTIGSWLDEAEETEEGLTALNIAARNGSVEIIELLLEEGANPMIKSKKGISNLHFAAIGNSPLIMALFLTKGLTLSE